MTPNPKAVSTGDCQGYRPMKTSSPANQGLTDVAEHHACKGMFRHWRKACASISRSGRTERLPSLRQTARSSGPSPAASRHARPAGSGIICFHPMTSSVMTRHLQTPLVIPASPDPHTCRQASCPQASGHPAATPARILFTLPNSRTPRRGGVSYCACRCSYYQGNRRER